MWNEILNESEGNSRRNRNRWITIVLSVSLHGVLIAVLVLSSYWVVEAVQPVRPTQPYVYSAGPKLDPIRVVIRTGTTNGNDRQPKNTTAEPIALSAPVTQESAVSNQGNLEDLPPSTTPFSLNAGEDGGTGPLGDPNGNSTEGALAGNGQTIEPPIVIGVGVESPVLIQRVTPEYPETMRRLRIQGTVVLKAIIDRNGNVEVKQVERSLHPILDREAMRAVSLWKYKPATVEGRPVSVWFTVTVSYKLS